MSMALTLPGMHTPAAGFDEPFEVLAGCHERVRRSLALLQRVADHLASHTPDTRARDAAGDVLRYFERAAPAHHEDEERHVLPLLRSSGEPALEAAATRLLADHDAIRSTWAALRPLLQQAADGRCNDLAALTDAAERFVRAHDGHLELEDTLAFPAAARLHPHPGEMGREMALRRGVALPGEPIGR